MDEKYLLTELIKQVRRVRKAQKEYYACRADPRTDMIKKGLLQESRRHEQDLDGLLITIQKAFPVAQE